MANRLRNKAIQFMLTEEENRLFREKLTELGVTDISAFLRRMVFRGCYIQIDTSDLKEALRLSSITANNINQIAKRANETGRVYPADIEDIQNRQKSIEALLHGTYRRLSALEKY